MSTVSYRPDVVVPPEPVRPRPWWWAHREHASLAALLAGTAVLYLWNLGASGNANDFYAAAVQAGTKSWKAFFFGSFDSSNFITVDKPPASLWPMEISGRIFGFNSWSMLAPQAVEGVLAVWLLYAAVRRWFGHGAGLLAGLLLAVTPVAALMFRFNNPDALMTLLIVLAAYCTVRAIEHGSTRWLVIAGLVMGLSFLAKGLQPFTVLPALALAFLVCVPGTWWRRVLQLLAAGVAIVVGAGWWVLAVDLTPASSRPYIGGSGNNTALGLAFGYNGVSRITGSSGGGPGGGGGGGFSGTAGVGRLFNNLNGGQIAWLLPTALVAVLATAVVTRRVGRTDRLLAALILWGGWVLVTGGVLSYADGIIHTYYSVELAPAIAAVVAIGAVTLWRARAQQAARVGLAVGALVTGIWSFRLLDRAPDWNPWVRWVVLIAAILAAGALLIPPGRARRGLAAAAAVVGIVALGGGSAAYAVDAATTPQQGSTPSAGPSTGSAFGGGARGGPGGTGARGGFGRTGEGRTGGFPMGGFPGGSGSAPGGTGGFPGAPGGTSGSGTSGSGTRGSGTRGSGTGGSGTGGSGTGGSGTGGSGSAPTGTSGDRPSGTTRGAGGFGGGQSANSALVALLKKTSNTWSAATIGSQSAGPLELASGKAVMAIGGFSGSDATPTLAQFQKYVAEGKIHYFVSGGGFGGGRGGGTGSAISSWVVSHYTAKTVSGTTVYDLTAKAK
ncbi:ArnT family glycosyltransferase [uncultured Jatrophihabitans sp.]|uniref:ArnT family glycosyltransferase n=1 Tax=uncultured Jatrophihabitans sp. TaxID=1610747 RepID=UPI0035CA956A